MQYILYKFEDGKKIPIGRVSEKEMVQLLPIFCDYGEEAKSRRNIPENSYETKTEIREGRRVYGLYLEEHKGGEKTERLVRAVSEAEMAILFPLFDDTPLRNPVRSFPKSFSMQISPRCARTDRSRSNNI